MSYNRIGQLLKLFYMFFSRNVLNFGILSKKYFRVLFATAIVSLIAYFTFILSCFFIDNNSSMEQTTIVLDTYSCSVIMLTFLVFLFMKLIFMKKGVFISITRQMPITKKELNTATLIYEMSITLLIIVILSFSMSAATLISNGMGLILRVICNVIFTSITTYFILELIYELLNIIIVFFRLENLKNIILICSMTTMLFYVYIAFIPSVFQKILYGYVDGVETSPFVFFSYISEKYGFPISLVIFLVANFIIITCIIHLPKDKLKMNNSYIHTFKKNKVVTCFRAYLFAFARNNDTYNYFFISMFLYFILKWNKVEYSYFAILLLTINAIYAYVQSETIRLICIQKDYSVYKDYINIIGAQFAYICLFSLPMLVFEIITNVSIVNLLVLYVIILVAIVFFSMIGILFPAKQENPFSAIVGTVAIMLMILIGGLMSLLFNNDQMIFIMSTFLTLTSIGVSLLGIKKMYLKKRYI